jgi:predicted nucleic acid-binding protein
MANLHDTLELGRAAEELLAPDSVLTEALKELQERYTNDWKNSKVNEVEQREKAYMAIIAIEDLKTQLQTYTDRAMYAQRQMQRG